MTKIKFCETLILAILKKYPDTRMTGYGIIKKIKELKLSISTGTFFPLMEKMIDKGYVVNESKYKHVNDYKITDQGLKHLVNNIDDIAYKFNVIMELWR